MMDPFFLHHSDDNEKNTFNKGDNKRHGLKNVTCKQTFMKFILIFITNIPADIILH